MTDYHIIGAENSPYSIKVRSYFRYKDIPHQWLRRAEAQDEYQRHARLPLVPLVVTPDDQGMQDSTPIIETIEAIYPTPSIHPGDSTCRFVSALLEEFGDEWGNKWMFHYRWAREADQLAASTRLVTDMMTDATADQIESMAAGIRERMVDRVWFVGSSAQTTPQIEASFVESVALLDKHLAGRDYLFGGAPSFGDFGLWAQIYNADKDPTPHEIIKGHANLCGWLERMVSPEARGSFESWSDVAATLTPLLERQVGALFLPWSVANAAAIKEGLEEFSIDLNGQEWTQKPQKYHAHSLAALQARYAELQDEPTDEVLEATGCLSYLR
jgi:glutathione S-transferase